MVLDPLGYLEFLSLMADARLVLTDSGGIQEETTVLGVPCLTLRRNTERPVTVEQGTNVLVGNSREAIVAAADKALAGAALHARVPELWDGKASERIAAILHGVHSRALAGNAASNDAAETGGRAVAVADVAWRTVQALG